MLEDVVVLQSTDARVGPLRAQGYVVTAESWGARLRVDSAADLAAAHEAVDAARGRGFEVRELFVGSEREVVALEALTQPDYPQTPATPHPLLSAADVEALRASGMRFFGAFDDGALVAVTAIRRDGDHAETEFTSVHPRRRRQGLALAVKAASVLALSGDGVRVFGTGGAQVNVASLRTNEHLGYAVEERWLSLRAPAR